MTTYNIDGWTARDNTLTLHPTSEWGEEPTVENAYTTYIAQKRASEEATTVAAIAVVEAPQKSSSHRVLWGWLSVIVALVLAPLTAGLSLAVWFAIFANGVPTGVPTYSAGNRGKTYHQMFYPHDPSKWPSPQG